MTMPQSTLLAAVLVLTASAGFSLAQRVDPSTRRVPTPQSIFVPVEQHDVEICVEYKDGDAFYEDCFIASDLHAILRAAGRSGQ